MLFKWIAAAALLFGFALLWVAPPALAHETDQFTVAPDREYGDVGVLLSQWFYDTMARGTQSLNERIDVAVRAGDHNALTQLHSDQEVVPAVNHAFPWAMEVIEGWERRLNERELWEKFPGQVLIYQHHTQNIYQGAYFPLDPRQIMRIWNSGTLKAFGTFLGTDKIGHFTDMGMNYWREFSKARQAGASVEEAQRKAVSLGTEGLIFSERGLLGYLTAGSYSNGDLSGNFTGMLFYRNLTEPISIKGKLRPPMLIRDGQRWRIAPYIDRDTFFSMFICDHMDELLNPSHYEAGMRNAVRQRITERANIDLEHYHDANGQRRPREWFAQRHEACRTYYGADYGHYGPHDQLIRIADVAFPPDRALSDPRAVLRTGDRYNSDWGCTALHLAARDGDLTKVTSLITQGARVNARNDQGVTPLHCAASNNRLDVISHLIARGADPSLVDARGRTPLHFAVNDDVPDTRVIALLIDHRADPNFRDADGQTPLHLAARNANPAVVDLLLRRGARPEAKDAMGVTPLHLAAARNDLKSVGLLVAAGADPNGRDQFGSTPLHDASRARAHLAVATLLRHGANPRIADAYGKRPADLARMGNDGVALALFNDPAMSGQAVPAAAKLPARGVRGRTSGN